MARPTPHRNRLVDKNLPVIRRIMLVCLLGGLVGAFGLMRVAASSAQSPQQPGGANKAAEDEKDVRVLELGPPIEREIAGGQSHSYHLSLTQGQYAKVIVEQRGIDVTVLLTKPHKEPTIEYNNEAGKFGEEAVSLVAKSEGQHSFTVRTSLNKSVLGKYQIKIAELRAADEKDISLDEAFRLHTESLNLSLNGNNNEALIKAERSLQIRQNFLEQDHPHIAESINILASIHMARGDYPKAETLHRRALEITEKGRGPEHPYIATVLSHLGLLSRLKGDYENAEHFYQRALTIRKKTLGTEHIFVAHLLNNLAVLSEIKGNYQKAESFYYDALRIVESELGTGHSNFALTLSNLAQLNRVKGDLLKAEDLALRALAIREKQLETDHPQIADSLNLLGLLHHEKGDFVKAERFHQQALSIREKRFGAEHVLVATSLDNIGSLLQDMGDRIKAERHLRRALEIREKRLAPNHPDIASSLNNLGVLSEIKGDYVETERLYQRALNIRKEQFGPEHISVATSLNNLAILSKHRGDYEKESSLYEQARSIFEKTIGPEHPSVAILLSNHARAAAARNKQQEAVKLLNRANEIIERNTIRHMMAGSERQKLSYLTLFTIQVNLAISLHTKDALNDPLASVLAFTGHLQRKGRSLEAMSDNFVQLRHRTKTEDKKLFDQYNDALSQLANLTFRGAEGKLPTEYLALLRKLENQIEEIEITLSQRSAEFRQQIKPITIEAVQAVINKNSALIEIASYSPVDFKTGKLERPRYIAYILIPQNELRWADLGEAEPIDQAVAEFRKALHSSKATNVKALARRLDEKVMRPIRKLLGPTRNILLSPDGALNLVPFAALVDEQNRYLVERYSFTYLTSGRDLLRYRPEGQIAKAPVIVADPDFGEKSTDRKTASSTGILDLTEAYFSPLAATAQEAKALQAIMPQATVLTRGQATETALKQIASPSILHIATHGFFLADKPEDATETERRRKLLQQTGNLASLGGRLENPLLRSGLGLAGANLRKSGDDDGILTAMEVAGLNLWGTKLAVLSACETGVGEVRTGEGVYGLRRALVLAGAETQVMSLWPVSDRGTRDLMIGYYKRLQAGAGRSEAMRQVQLRMLKDPRRRHPFYWASFIVSGEWANLDGKR